jgi:hypothetical protein
LTSIGKSSIIYRLEAHGRTSLAKVTLAGPSGQASIEIGDLTPLAKLQLLRLTAPGGLPGEFKATLDHVKFDSAKLGVTFPAPTLNIDPGLSLTITAGNDATLTLYRAADSPLFGPDPAVPEIAIAPRDYWLSFELDTTFSVSAGAAASGFGVSADKTVAVALTGYSLFDQTASFGDAVRETLENFAPLSSTAAVRGQKTGTVLVADTSGTVTVTGSYSFPISVNQLSLAEATVPLRIDINPNLDATVTGDVSLTGDFSVRCWKRTASELVFGIFKKHGTNWSASINTQAGLEAGLAGKDLIETFFHAVIPGVDLQKSGLSKEHPDYAAIVAALEAGIDRNLAISTNASCAASFGDESAAVYEIDLSVNETATDQAIASALKGHWTALSMLSNARELKNVAGKSREAKATLAVNLLGVLNYEKIGDFLRSSTVLHCIQDGSITITDEATARRIAVASTPFAADPVKLRHMLDVSMIATAVYNIASGKFRSALTTDQNLVIYRDAADRAGLAKLLLLAPALGVETAVAIDNPKPRHILIEASQQTTDAQALRIFFSDTSERTPRDVGELTSLGRRTLAKLLDPASPVDAKRIAILSSDEAWQQMDAQRFPMSTSPASYSDWYNVTFWANSVHNAGKPLKDVLDAIDAMPAGTDPSADAGFTQKRQSLSQALSAVTKDSNAAFEKGWPMAVTYALAGTSPVLTARWDGVQRIRSAVIAARAQHSSP